MKLHKPKLSKWVQVSEGKFERMSEGAISCDYDGYGSNAPTTIEQLKKMLDAFDPKARVAIYCADDSSGNLALRIELKEAREATLSERVNWVQDRAKEAQEAAQLQINRRRADLLLRKKKITAKIEMFDAIIQDLYDALEKCPSAEFEDLCSDLKTVQDEKAVQVEELNRLLNL